MEQYAALELLLSLDGARFDATEGMSSNSKRGAHNRRRSIRTD
jgi:hypothetical protein